MLTKDGFVIPEDESISHVPFEIIQIQKFGEVSQITFDKSFEIGTTPGQYTMAWIPGIDEKPYMIGDDKPVTLFVNNVGPFSNQISSSEIKTVFLRPPQGNGFSMPSENDLSQEDAFSFIVTNTAGISSLNFLINKLPKISTSRITVLISQEILRKMNLQIAFLNYRVLRLEEKLLRTPSTTNTLLRSSTHIYTDDHTIPIEQHTNMKVVQGLNLNTYFRCSMGLCGSCEYNGKLMCTEGPVVDMKR